MYSELRLRGKTREDIAAYQALEHLSPEQLVEDILAKERRIIEIMEEIKAELLEHRPTEAFKQPRIRT